MGENRRGTRCLAVACLAAILALTSGCAVAPIDRFSIVVEDKKPAVIVPPGNDHTGGRTVFVDGVRWSCAKPATVVVSSDYELTLRSAYLFGVISGGPLEILISPSGSWNRGTLKNLATDLRAQLSQPQFTDCIKTTTAQLAADRIFLALADLAPRDFGADLDIRYGFNPDRQKVDLLPGMRLRVETSGVAYLEQPIEGDITTQNVEHFVGAVRDFDVVELFDRMDKRWSLELAAPLARLRVEAGREEKSEDSNDVNFATNAAGMADLVEPVERRTDGQEKQGHKYWRLLYPGMMGNIGVRALSAQAEARIPRFMLLVASQTLDGLDTIEATWRKYYDVDALRQRARARVQSAQRDLDRAKRKFDESRRPEDRNELDRRQNARDRAQQEFDRAVRDTTPAVNDTAKWLYENCHGIVAYCFVLRDRTVAYPTISVRVNGEIRWVPVGMTLGELLADGVGGRRAVDSLLRAVELTNVDMALLQRERFALQLKTLRLTRAFAGNRAELTFAPSVSTELSDAVLRLPLVAGDILSW
jgi:hypothetical protein